MKRLLKKWKNKAAVTIVYLINGMHPHGLDNGSVTILEYEDGQFNVEVVGDRSYRELGREKMEETNS